MPEINYRITYADGTREFVKVRARTINNGFGKALKEARKPLGNGTAREIHSVEFWSK